VGHPPDFSSEVPCRKSWGDRKAEYVSGNFRKPGRQARLLQVVPSPGVWNVLPQYGFCRFLKGAHLGGQNGGDRVIGAEATPICLGRCAGGLLV